jgi:prepilin peptidase dependent protein B
LEQLMRTLQFRPTQTDPIPVAASGGAGRQMRGLSIVEMLVGLAVGLVIVASAASLFVTNLSGSRKMLVEARLNQDLRAAADVITRDLRRAGYWANAMQGVLATGSGSTTVANPYKSVTATADPGSGHVGYAYSKDAVEDNTLDNNESFGFRLSGGALQMQVDAAPTWQTMTDPGTLTVTSLALTRNEVVVPIGNACINPCAASSPTCPTVTVRSYGLVIAGRAVSDPGVTRTLRTMVRVRNDRFDGACP